VVAPGFPHDITQSGNSGDKHFFRDEDDERFIAGIEKHGAEFFIVERWGLNEELEIKYGVPGIMSPELPGQVWCPRNYPEFGITRNYVGITSPCPRNYVPGITRNYGAKDWTEGCAICCICA